MNSSQRIEIISKNILKLLESEGPYFPPYILGVEHPPEKSAVVDPTDEVIQLLYSDEILEMPPDYVPSFGIYVKSLPDKHCNNLLHKPTVAIYLPPFPVTE